MLAPCYVFFLAQVMRIHCLMGYLGIIQPDSADGMKWDSGLRLIMYGRVGELNRVFVGANWDVAAVRFRATRAAGWQGRKCYEVNEASE
jgi:hypothetical protein